MLSIRKISKNFYLVGGEYTASNFNEAVIIANKNNKIKGFEVDYMQVSLKRYLKFKAKRLIKILWYHINKPIDMLMEWV